MKKLVKTVRYYNIHCDCCDKEIDMVQMIYITKRHKENYISKHFTVCQECCVKIGRALQNGAGKYNQICEEMLHYKELSDTIVKYEFSGLIDMKNYHEYEYYTESVKLD